MITRRSVTAMSSKDGSAFVCTTLAGALLGGLPGVVAAAGVPQHGQAVDDQPNGTVRCTALRSRLRASPTPRIRRAPKKTGSMLQREA